MKFLTKTIHFLGWGLFAGFCGLVLISASMYLYLSPALPDVQKLRDFKLQTPMRILSSDNKLMAEYGEQRRAPLNYDDIPIRFVQALVAIEDKRFEKHIGVDPVRFTRVVLDVLLTGDKEGAGGSTLTQQVARNYFLTQQKTFTRKFTEILLALKMESELSKADIFELYANKHFLGYRSYGIQAAATVYYGKDINDLSLAQMAMIAGLHQAPSYANPIANKTRAMKRRNTVLIAMLLNKSITQTEFDLAIKEPITAKYHGNNPDFEAWYLAEMVRSEMLDRYGDDAYNDGYTVYTTVNSERQEAANKGVRKTLVDYSRRHGYLGPELRSQAEGFDPHSRLSLQLEELNSTPTFGGLVPALVLQSGPEGLTVQPKNSTELVKLDLESIKWARERIKVDEFGEAITNGHQVANSGDIVRLEVTDDGWQLAQVPRAQGALIALSPNDGSVQALVGGFDYILNKYNRVTQSVRQPGSNFKPFIYSAALDKGYTPASIINDAPIVRTDSSIEDVWRPKNSGDRYLGPIPMRQALYQSRNLSSIRILDDIGVSYARNYAARFGFDINTLANDMTLILGSSAMSPMDVARGYATFANGGHLIEPYFIDRIEDKNGNILFEANPAVVCRGCPESSTAFSNADITAATESTEAINIAPLELSIEGENIENTITERRYAPQVISPQTAFLIDSMLKDVVLKGTGSAAYRALPRTDLAGKTGTTNDAVDAWFTGYNGDVVASTWVGYDSNVSLGYNEFGGKAALPGWIEFMKVALMNKPANNLPQPVGITQVRIDPNTGLLAMPSTPDAQFEYFREGSAPTEYTSSNLSIDFSAEESQQPVENNSQPAQSVEELF